MNKNKFITSARKAPKKTSQNKDLYTFVIVSDTPGYRMKSYGPTSLITLNNKKLLDEQIESIEECFDNYEIILCCGNEVEKVHKYVKAKYPSKNIRIVENQIFNNSNSCESVRIAMNNTINDKIYVIDGRLLICKNLFRDRLNESYVYIEETPCDNLEVGINTNEDGFVEHFSYGASRIWSEIVYIGEKNTLENFRKIINNVDYKNKFLFEALNDLLKIKKDMKCVANKNPVKKINNIKTYHSVKEAV